MSRTSDEPRDASERDPGVRFKEFRHEGFSMRNVEMRNFARSGIEIEGDGASVGAEAPGGPADIRVHGRTGPIYVDAESTSEHVLVGGSIDGISGRLVHRPSSGYMGGPDKECACGFTGERWQEACPCCGRRL